MKKTRTKREERKLIAKTLSEAGISIEKVAELLGHKKMETAKHYSSL
jgi:site-specific recombinase XerD